MPEIKKTNVTLPFSKRLFFHFVLDLSFLLLSFPHIIPSSVFHITMVHVITTQPPRRHDSLMQKSSRHQFQTPHNPSPQAPFPTTTNNPQLHYLKPTTTSTWSPLDFSSLMVGIRQRQSQLYLFTF